MPAGRERELRDSEQGVRLKDLVGLEGRPGREGLLGHREAVLGLVKRGSDIKRLSTQKSFPLSSFFRTCVTL